MRVQSFMGKVSIEGLHQLDDHINNWVKRSGAHPTMVNQCFGLDRPHDGRAQEPIVVVTIWYEGEEIEDED